MRARGIRSYHRPGQVEEALDLLARGAVPLGGGTRLFATAHDLPNLLDLSALGLNQIALEDGDLVLGASVTLQDVVDSEAAFTATAGLLPAACRTHSPSRMLRGMATLGGEAVQGAPDSEVSAALLALNAVFVVAHPEETRESPALRFVRQPREDLRGGGFVSRIVIPGEPDGAALERAALLPSAPCLVGVAVTVAFSGEKCSRARIALCGLDSRPGRILEAEAQVERTAADEEAQGRAAEQAARHAALRADRQASTEYKRHLVRVLTRRALRRALAQAREGRRAERAPTRGRSPSRGLSSLAYFTSGRVDLTVNGKALHAEVEARTTLAALLRREGYKGTKDVCGTGHCGACTVLLDGRPLLSCLTLAVRAHGRAVHTVEGLAGPRPSPLPDAFLEASALHCGFCAPAMAMSARARLEAGPGLTEAEARDALGGCLCPCMGADRPVQAVLAASGRAAP